MYTKTNLQVSEIQVKSNFSESLWLRITLKGSNNITLGCIFRSPSSSVANNEMLNDLIKCISGGSSPLVIMGDFNMKEIDWGNVTSISSDQHHSSKFLNTVQDCFLHQHIQYPTRYRHGQEPSILDLILTNEEGLVKNVKYLPGLWKSDHICLRFQVICYPDLIKPQPRLLLNRGNYQKMRDGLRSVKWDEEMANLTTQEAWECLDSHLKRWVDECIPTSLKVIGYKQVYTTREVMALRAKKKSLWHVYCESNTQRDHTEFKQARNKLRKVTRGSAFGGM